MKILFVHQNFPAQFFNIAVYLSEISGNSVASIGSETAQSLPNIPLFRYSLQSGGVSAVHPFARRFDVECRRAEQVMYSAYELERSGFIPDVIFVHGGWGESIPMRAMFPRARIVAYCEYFYREAGSDVDFDPEWAEISRDGAVAVRAKNASTLLSMADADVAIAPTRWQRSTFPSKIQSMIEVCHEGIDIDAVHADATASFVLPNQTRLRAGDEVVTFVSRNLEPLRGYHSFMRSLPMVLKQRPHAQVLIIGGDGVSYGARPPNGQTWQSVFLRENQQQLDLSRVHFLGRVNYSQYINVLRVSAAHVYLTYPFVLSWSMLEAMAAECLVIASSTAPVHEVIDGTNGILVDFFDYDAIAAKIIDGLTFPHHFNDLRRKARLTVSSHYSKTECLSHLLKIIM